MLLDNKTPNEDNKPYKVAEWMKRYAREATGTMDLAAGYFSINGLLFLRNEFDSLSWYRLILENLVKEKEKEAANRVVDLLNGDHGINESLLLHGAAQRAVEFLRQEKVSIRAVPNNFCHAKTYIHHDKDDCKSFHIVGSSNLTDAGLGLRESSNIELNIAETGENANYRDLKKWFEHQWNYAARETMETPDKTRITAKQHFINMIGMFFREYSPLELYYKVLYELFKNDFLSLSGDAEFNRVISHLNETGIYNALYPYQKNGVLSLIRMFRDCNGAILADAVGLGKTWTALAVMKYFELKNYTVILFCPKKLRNNWEQYQAGRGSRFERDELDFHVRNITDLQDDRLNYYELSMPRIQKKKNLLIVVDESHNLRNDKSLRYKFLVDNILLPEKKNRDVKLLHISATPINNQLLDIRNQFKLIARGEDSGFKETSLAVSSLEDIFRQAQKDFNEWSKHDNRKISDFISKLPQKFFALTDSLIVARTRKLIEGEYGEMRFPKKEKPVNEFITPENFGELKSFDDILDALKTNLTAYRPAEYVKEEEQKTISVLKDEKQRQRFLVQMMYIMMIKRLESSWFSFKLTVGNILEHHRNALEKVNQYIATTNDAMLNSELNDDEDELEELVETQNDAQFTLGKKNPVPISAITDLEKFKENVMLDIARLERLKQNLDQFENDFRAGRTCDLKLEKLIEYIRQKQNAKNRKILIFTGFADTARFLFDELKNRGIGSLAYVSGSQCKTSDDESDRKFEEILQRFAPVTKLYREKDWSHIFEKASLSAEYRRGDDWNVPFEKWLELLAVYEPQYYWRVKNPIDVLIATDCLSEGQNLQDCDLIINYDIHWNPVRLIQRMGRIDRLGSPNETIRGVNFWPAKDCDSYLKLKSRVEKRMALMSVVGSEFMEELTPELQAIVAENPLISRQTEKMLKQLELTWDDVETGEETLGLNNLSLEQFRQDLFDFFKKREDFFKQIPNGVYTGFRFRRNKSWTTVKQSIVAALGYPRRPPETNDHSYSEIILLHQNYADGKVQSSSFKNNQEILAFLRHHKDEKRFVPDAVEKGEKSALDALAGAVSHWITAQARPEAARVMDGLFSGDISPKTLTPDTKKSEEKFKAENFDLINWFVISE